ncbi:NAD-dependent epimerase/dehydratase family protein [Marinitenerispora sediminis]|uniref:Nucleoside-diphosphate sugar epimerase n=1 Tax=Marinitenerispora sediminis TaxID=1931232 RepID=A0A368T126_9ACTN|nr:NAD-dependent epimerase/dehydratase family protein [Marinitenerispora sediminis]RCV50770.1 nucleoside-diphosphate sugar epimerase [Marinitenerispora sediminis]RCV52676.1 nucleoside-diphosphate sugar epimerase [Marinitenerispora sediminis]RCV53613.1 nucleoside-diphosphate sugar epimerase [Marinitenerispora sediminis]
MKAVVTGGAGFIGSHLCDHLIAHGHQVVALDDLSTGSEANLAQLRGNPAFTLVRGSILDAGLVGDLVSRCDTVFHLAAAVGVHTIVDDPLRSLRTNLHGTENVVEAAAAHGARFLIASTSEVYGKNDADGLTEDADRVYGSPLKSRWSYAAAKGLDELVAYVHSVHTGLPCVITRFFNIVGPRQTGRYGMVVPRFVDQALAGEPITVYGSGDQRRCFGSVFDVVPAAVRLLDTPEAHRRAVNLGGTEEVTIRELADRVVALTGSSSEIRYVSYEDAYGAGYEDMRRRMPDITLAHRLTGFRPRRRLDDIIASIVQHRRTAAAPRAAVA